MNEENFTAESEPDQRNSTEAIFLALVDANMDAFRAAKQAGLFPLWGEDAFRLCSTRLSEKRNP